MQLDRDGQPPPSFHAHNNLKKGLEHLLGLCRGMVADDVLNEAEIVFLDTWLAENTHVLDTWPGEILNDRVRRILRDGRVTQDEADDLKQTINQVIGGDLENGVVAGGASSLPIDSSAMVSIPDSTFCFTGKFLYGSRAACSRAVEGLNGKCVTRVTQKLDYLVIGALASRDWKHSSYGTKIEEAIEQQTSGHSITIVGEDQWAVAL